MVAGIHAAKLIACIGCKQIGASIGCNIISCIQKVSSFCNYHCEVIMDAGAYAAKPNASIGCSQTVCM